MANNGHLALLFTFSLCLAVGEVLFEFDCSSFVVEESRSVAVGCEVEGFVDEVSHGCFLVDVVLLSEPSEVLPVHDDESGLF